MAAETAEASAEPIRLTASKTGSLRENTNIAVSVGVKPWTARDRDKSLNVSRNGA